ncbi:DNA methyltransferase [Sphingomonas oryzagri]|uniref:site-specific DNA-methyltransferase (adenine-specific) n=1 Tax=Sphingomonas oryzagri TaxID=3042314 RepID=A0ABT6N7A2_9SPHN|nr:DNA methyltransferase [Sphingomonas oryzagri]MDH7640968.1 DNA methyltransferase [Sphingomonas oryzagri]
MGNRLYYGDNLDVLREHVRDESVDLVYLDPPFNSNTGYNLLFASAASSRVEASIEAFDDTWTWSEASRNAMLDIDGGSNRTLQVMMRAMHDALGDSPLMAYLAMMAVRLVELHRVLKGTGSLYLHCDPTASHYLKLVLDAVFGAENYQAEIIWRRTNSRSTSGKWPRLHDTIFHYSRTSAAIFHAQTTLGEVAKVPHTLITGADGRKYNTFELTGAGRTKEGESGKPWRNFDPDRMGRHWGYSHTQLDEWAAGGLIHFPAKNGFPRRRAEEPFDPNNRLITVGDVWSDIDRLNQTAKERLGYPTQKPRALLERIIAASSNPGDVVLDPFCGCGTAVDAAQKLGRQWIGIDVTHIAIGMIENRMREGHDGIVFDTIGVPKDLASAERLAADDPHQFQQWVSWQVGGYPRDKKGGDKGVDGWFNYLAQGSKIETGVISVKAGDSVNPTMVRDLGRVMQRDRHRFGLFIMKALPTRGMREEAASHPTIETEFGRFPALQIVTLAELMHGHRPKLPPLISPVKKAARVETRKSHQPGAQGSLL